MKEDFDRHFTARAAARLGPLTRAYFRYRLRGAARLPEGEACLIVGNHSALGSAELLCLIPALWDAVGDARRINGLQHDFFIDLPGIGHFYRKVGAIRASQANGEAALRAGHDVLVFPGGDIDSCRPFYEPRKVHFGARRGYIRLALRAGVRVVPMATIGSHYTWLMAPGGAWLSRALGLKRWLRAERVPLPAGVIAAGVATALLAVGAIPLWAFAALALVSLLPTPARITTELLEPIDIGAMTAHLEDEEERVEAAHDIVYGRLSSHVAEMEHETPAEAHLARA
jgi:1-acyl-sn-glycerol-3-phosphate acyltransferase